MRLWDLIGYLAAALVLAAFCMREMVPLRIAALCSNLAFIAYGLGLDLAPVWLLHALLLPMNGCRLLEALPPRRTPVKRIIRPGRFQPIAPNSPLPPCRRAPVRRHRAEVPAELPFDYRQAHHGLRTRPPKP